MSRTTQLNVDTTSTTTGLAAASSRSVVASASSGCGRQAPVGTLKLKPLKEAFKEQTQLVADLNSALNVVSAGAEMYRHGYEYYKKQLTDGQMVETSPVPTEALRNASEMRKFFRENAALDPVLSSWVKRNGRVFDSA